MMCQKFRSLRWLGLASSSVVCLALITGYSLVPPTWAEDQTPSLTPAAHDLPPAAVPQTSGVRIEKQAQSHRLFLKKPERTARFPSLEQAAGVRPYRFIRLASTSLPRRHLYAPRSQSSSPDDPSDLPLS